MLHIVKIPNNEGDINNMRKFILGLSFLGFGDIGFLIVFTYTLNFQPGIALKASRAGNLHVIGTLNLCFRHTHIMFFRKFKSCL